MNTYFGIMRWLWFKISGRVLFGMLHQVLRPIIFVQTQEIHSVHSLIYQSYSEFPASAETEQTIQVWRGFKNVFQHNLVMVITASHAKYSGGKNLLVLFHVYNENNYTHWEFIRIRGLPLLVSINNWVIAPSTFGITTNLNKSDFGSRSLFKQKRRFQISDHFESIWQFRKR